MRIFVCLLAALSACAATAQPLPEIVTDRPDFTESGVTVPAGHVQIEAGANWERVVDTSNLILPETLVRWAPIERFELRFGFPNYMAGEDPTGFSDGSIGAKIQLGPVSGLDVGLIAAASLPVGQEELTSDSVDPEFILTMGRDLTENVSLAGQAMVMRDGGDDVWQYGGTLVAGIGLTDQVGTFIEGMVLDQRANNVLVFIHHGYTYLVSSALQLDVHGGYGFLESGDGQAVVGLGVSALL